MQALSNAARASLAPQMFLLAFLLVSWARVSQETNDSEMTHLQKQEALPALARTIFSPFHWLQRRISHRHCPDL